MQIFSLQAALVSSLGTLGADELQVCQNSGLEALDPGQVLIPHLGVGQNGVHQLSSGVVLVCIVEVQSPCVILDLVGVACRALADEAVSSALLNVVGVESDVSSQSKSVSCCILF